MFKFLFKLMTSISIWSLLLTLYLLYEHLLEYTYISHTFILLYVLVRKSMAARIDYAESPGLYIATKYPLWLIEFWVITGKYGATCILIFAFEMVRSESHNVGQFSRARMMLAGLLTMMVYEIYDVQQALRDIALIIQRSNYTNSTYAAGY